MFLVVIKLKLYTLWHTIACHSELEIAVPTEEYVNETGDNKVYMTCVKCGKRHYLTSITFDDKSK